MVVRALNSTRVVSLGIVVLVAFLLGALVPGVVEAQAATAKPPTTAKPAQPPAKPSSPPAARPATPAVVKPAAPAAKPVTPAVAKPAAPAAKPVAPAAGADASKPAAPAPAAGKVTVASLAGTWDGVAQTPNGDMPVHMVLTHQEGKITGSIDTQMGALSITGSTLTGDVLELGFDLQGSSGGLSGKVEGDKYSGSWSVGADTGPFAVTRVPVAGANLAAPAAAAADPISGEWSGDSIAGEQTVPFAMTLKLSGETVTGEMATQGFKVPLTSGGWKDGSLLLAFLFPSGESVSMRGQMVDGKLTGAFDYNSSEIRGTWTAVKK